MAEPDEFDEDLFADLYDADDTSAQPNSGAVPVAPAGPTRAVHQLDSSISSNILEPKQEAEPSQHQDEHVLAQNGDYENSWSNNASADVNGNGYGDTSAPSEHRAIGIKEDGKMFVGGLNWETTDQSLRDYFTQFGEVQECTVMRDSATGRSRGFGFLTFKDPKDVNLVMVKEHFLDGKIIDPKRAIPRDEQERTSKIFVGGVSQDATEQDFKEYFMKYGRVVDATLMMDKDTGRPRGFGFVTFDSEAAVEATLQGDLMILGKPIEVKKAQPRGNLKEEEERDRRGGRRGRDNDRFDHGNHNSSNQNTSQQQGVMGNATPQMMAMMFAKLQQFYAQAQQMAAIQNSSMANAMGMGAAMNPAMMQQYQKQMQMALMQQQMQSMQVQQQQGSQSPNAAAQNMQQTMQNMNPAMMQQMQQYQQQMQAASQGQQSAGGFGSPVPNAPTGPSGNGGRRGTPGYNAQEQLMFEQQKYEQQQARRAAQDAQQMQYQPTGPTSWEGMYDDVPQPNVGNQGGSARGGGYPRGNKGGPGPNRNVTPQQPPNAPANAPTGPKNAGVPGANYRGGGRGGHRGGFHPYRR